MAHLDWQFAVINSDEVNAFVVPGGKVGGCWDGCAGSLLVSSCRVQLLLVVGVPTHADKSHPSLPPQVVVYTGLLQLMRTEDELAAVLAHEVRVCAVGAVCVVVASVVFASGPGSAHRLAQHHRSLRVVSLMMPSGGPRARPPPR
jgi:hypothetical protein